MKLLRLSIAIALLCTAVFADAPQQITGRVIDQSSQKPVENAVFYIESTNQFVQSDANGTFKMNVLPGEYVAQIMRVGYETAVQTIAIRESASQPMLIALKQQPVTVEDITVTEKASSLTLQSDVYAREISETSPKDVGLFLRSQPGFGAIRRGGYAIDPVMRGFKYEQLNVQFDGGIKVSHACPNRMDPVTSHIRAQDLEKIEIVKGPYTVRYGQTLGGVVNLVQKRPALTQTLNAHAEIESGYDSNGDSRTARGAVTISDQKYDLFISGGTQDAGNYENGDGVEIPSSYRVNDYLIRAGFRRRKITACNFPGGNPLCAMCCTPHCRWIPISTIRTFGRWITLRSISAKPFFR
ncbi:MAG: carboxypeptidase-like regulatory domain-containing protein [Calditrichia bacterium]